MQSVYQKCIPQPKPLPVQHRFSPCSISLGMWSMSVTMIITWLEPGQNYMLNNNMDNSLPFAKQTADDRGWTNKQLVIDWHVIIRLPIPSHTAIGFQPNKPETLLTTKSKCMWLKSGYNPDTSHKVTRGKQGPWKALHGLFLVVSQFWLLR